MDIRLYNSFTNRVETFVPLKAGQVDMYVCGPTVYNYVHIGNMRPVVVFDVLRRFFERVGYSVKYVSNYTDVDDKIIHKALDEGKSELEIANYFISSFVNSVQQIHSRLPNVTPRVTEYMPKIIKFIEQLVKVGAAYQVDGDVYFRVGSVKDYGHLSNMKIEDLVVGARIEENAKKESPLDFTLWKSTDVGVAWDSPWSHGRPGWHTECVVMVDTIFPKKIIDIHGGGFDLKFPHHDNEIAQSQALNHNALAHYWMHNGFINMNNEKMSKSIGNVVLAKDAIAQYGGNTIRLLLLSTHYRAPVNVTPEIVASSATELQKMENVFRQLSVTIQLSGENLPNGLSSDIQPFLNALADDLNTSNALTEVFRTIKDANQVLRTRPLDIGQAKRLFLALKDMFAILGLEIDSPFLTEEDKQVYAAYQLAKAAKDFAKSDALRQTLIERKIL
jgi:cysteinyl-tRNA synthetase